MCFVWYQNCKNKCSGRVIAITEAGTPNKAAGINKNVNKLTRPAIG